MSVFRKAVDRLADLLRGDRRITYRASIDARLAPYIVPLLDKIVADDEDGDTFRNSLVPWLRAQRPPIAIYQGHVSTCRIDGPWQVAGRDWLPLGGLIVARGVTAHLDPFEAQALLKRMRRAIEDGIHAWVDEHDLHGRGHVPEEIDRWRADFAAKAVITAWVLNRCAADAMPSVGEASDSRPGAAVATLCALCGKAVGHG